eukprot:GHVL01020331.1.p1 GENE.GHVL01020331.1~~GHVL01020331.1.p1  ORF type:complete len:414 (+),score=48.06 GHVL01020331.1:415-1656(+)
MRMIIKTLKFRTEIGIKLSISVISNPNMIGINLTSDILARSRMTVIRANLMIAELMFKSKGGPLNGFGYHTQISSLQLIVTLNKEIEGLELSFSVILAYAPVEGPHGCSAQMYTLVSSALNLPLYPTALRLFIRSVRHLAAAALDTSVKKCNSISSHKLQVDFDFGTAAPIFKENEIVGINLFGLHPVEESLNGSRGKKLRELDERTRDLLSTEIEFKERVSRYMQGQSVHFQLEKILHELTTFEGWITDKYEFLLEYEQLKEKKGKLNHCHSVTHLLRWPELQLTVSSIELGSRVSSLAARDYWKYGIKARRSVCPDHAAFGLISRWLPRFERLRYLSIHTDSEIPETSIGRLVWNAPRSLEWHMSHITYRSKDRIISFVGKNAEETLKMGYCSGPDWCLRRIEKLLLTIYI